MKRITRVALVMGIMAVVAIAGMGQASAWGNVTICHATGSQSNPYVKQTVAVDSLDNGHGVHGINAGDIIPPFKGKSGPYPGHNWNYFTAYIWQHNCVVPELPTTTTTQQPTTTTTVHTTTSTTEGRTTSTTVHQNTSTTMKQSSSTTAAQRGATPTTVAMVTTSSELPKTGRDYMPAIRLAAALIMGGLALAGGHAFRHRYER